MNWQTLLTEKLMLGRVMVQYCRAPTMMWYKDGSERGSPSYKDKEDEVLIGVDACLQSNIWAR